MENVVATLCHELTHFYCALNGIQDTSKEFAALKYEEKYPLILFIPGSAWHKQVMYNDIPQYAALAKRGYVVAAMEYRESDIAPFSAQIEDVCNALKFIPSIAENFHIDTEHIFLMGNSSGGHIAMMTVLFSEHGLCERITKVSGKLL